MALDSATVGLAAMIGLMAVAMLAAAMLICSLAADYAVPGRRREDRGLGPAPGRTYRGPERRRR